MKKLLSLFCIIVFLLTSAFVLPVSATKTTIIASGNPNDYTQLGRDLYWELDSTGLLRIWGTGPMNAFSNNYGPFVDYRYQINRVIVEEGVTYIGDSAFYGCKNLKTIKQMKEYLYGLGYGPSVVNYCIEKLSEYNYVNDQNYANIYLSSVKNKYGKFKRSLFYLFLGITVFHWRFTDKLFKGF